MQTVYIPVQASNVNTFSTIPSGADTTSGYYLSYVAALTEEGGGFSGHGWCLDLPGNPFTGKYSIEEDIIDHYNYYNNLNDVFSSWENRVGDRAVSEFCHNMMANDTFYYAGCITMA